MVCVSTIISFRERKRKKKLLRIVLCVMIKGKREILKIVVRITNLWFVQSVDKKRHLEMTVMDEQVMLTILIFLSQL